MLNTNSFDLDQMLDQAVEVLNRALETDHETVYELFQHRVLCTEDLANDPTIVVGSDAETGKPDLGPLGLINGIFGIREDGSNMGYIAAVYTVICPNNMDIEADGKVGDVCPDCGEQLILGELIRFKRTDK